MKWPFASLSCGPEDQQVNPDRDWNQIGVIHLGCKHIHGFCNSCMSSCNPLYTILQHFLQAFWQMPKQMGNELAVVCRCMLETLAYPPLDVRQRFNR